MQLDARAHGTKIIPTTAERPVVPSFFQFKDDPVLGNHGDAILSNLAVSI